MPTGEIAGMPGRAGLARQARQAWSLAPPASGFGYLGLVWLLALVAAAMAVLGEHWTLAAQRERERELVFRAEQIRAAIERYRVDGGAWPSSIDELLEDRRESRVRHHLRRRYEDPFSGRADWVEIRDASGAMVGVRARSNHIATSLRAGGTATGRQRVSDWRFVAADAVPADPAQPSGADGTPIPATLGARP
jgi:type II secretory pathway pseudopilin PulG